MGTKELYDEYLITGMVDGFEPIEVVRAAQCTLTGADGRAYLDCFSGIAVVNAGHGHPHVLAAARAQMEALVHCGTYLYYSPRAGELARRLAAVTPGRLQKSFFGNSGAEAIEGALRLAKQFTGRKELIALNMGFHGRTAGTLSITGNRSRKKGNGPYLAGVAFAPAPYCYRCPLRQTYPGCGVACAEYLAEVLRCQTAGDVAAFVAEPVMGEGGIIVPPPEYFKIAMRHIRQDGALFLVDEVQSGFGRTGKLFAIEHYDVEPDLMAMAKGIADGFPLSAFIARAEIAAAFKPGDHLSTFGGNPVSCAAALANIEVLLAEDLCGNAMRRGAQIRQRLEACRERQPLIGEVRGLGLMIGVELVTDRQRTPGVQAARQIREACRQQGVLIGLGGLYGNVLRVQPPLVLTAAEADHACDVMEWAIKQVKI
jgi:4-aminobutyrate aminotransferase